MNIFLWILAGLLALMFLMVGSMKIILGRDKMAAREPERMDWVNDFSPSQIRLIGVVEVLGALGLILPLATGILTWLTPIAAVGLAIMMVSASAVHARRGEVQMRRGNIMIMVVALIIAIGRFVIPVA
jgi:uncharacterized membrane protein YphA (DoxX/SURF4 family)